MILSPTSPFRTILAKALVAAIPVMALGLVDLRADNIVSGVVWENFPNYTGGSEDGTFANVATMQAAVPGGEVTFDVASPIDFNSNVGGYTIGGFLGSGGATDITYSNGTASGDDLNNTLFYFTGSVSVYNGETFDVEHDDGLQLEIGGVMVVNEPGPTGAVYTPYTWTGASGTYSFDLAYAEVEGPPAVLDVQLPLTNSVPDGASTAALLGASLIGLFCLRRKLA